jgi:uncharacterized protein involved in response to NO
MRGHRPFFLGAAGFAGLAMGWWLWALGAGGWEAPLAPSAWHAHELIFGYLTAVLSGFLLTTTRGWRVPVLFGLWIAGRVAVAAMLLGAASPLAAACVDLAYLPALALLRDPPFWRRPKWPTLGFIPLLLAFAAADAAFQADALGILPGAAQKSLGIAVDLIALMIAVIAGRLVPGYTRAMLIPVKAPRHQVYESATVAIMLALIAADATGFDVVAGLAALLAAALQLLRLAGWRTRDVLLRPLLLILHLGFAWLALGLALLGLALLTPFVARSDALHGITAGAVGSLTIGMMVRLTRSHARLPPVADAGTTAAFALVFLAAVLRVFGPMLLPMAGYDAIVLAGACWIGGFALFVLKYAAV